MPAELKRCIKSWRKRMPDCQIKKWDRSNFDIDRIPYVAEAVRMRKWAFACDYIRVYALYTEGGIYLDSDVFLRRSLDFCSLLCTICKRDYKECVVLFSFA